MKTVASIPLTKAVEPYTLTRWRDILTHGLTEVTFLPAASLAGCERASRSSMLSPPPLPPPSLPPSRSPAATLDAPSVAKASPHGVLECRGCGDVGNGNGGGMTELSASSPGAACWDDAEGGGPVCGTVSGAAHRRRTASCHVKWMREGERGRALVGVDFGEEKRKEKWRWEEEERME